MKLFSIKKILIPIDFSDISLVAIDHAGFLAQLFKAEIVLLHVIEKNWEQFNIIAPELRIDVPSDLTNAIEKKLEETADSIRAKFGVSSIALTATGHIFSEILTIAKEHEVDLVVMGTHGVSGVVEFFVGSNAFKMVTLSDCPVMTVQGHSNHKGFKDILLPIDNSVHSRQKLNHAIVLAKHFGSRLHILGLDDSTDDQELKKFDHKLEQIEEYIKKCNLSFTRKIVRGKNQAVMTLSYAKTIDADLIIIMTDQDENITGRLMGVYAQQIVNHSQIPVLSISPVVSETPWVHPY